MPKTTYKQKNAREKKIRPLERCLREHSLPLLKGRAVATVGQISRISGIPESTLRNAIYSGEIPKTRLPGGTKVVDVATLCERMRATKTGRPELYKIAKTSAFATIGANLKKLTAQIRADIS